MAFHVKDLLITVVPVNVAGGADCSQNASLCTHPNPTDVGCRDDRSKILVDPEYFIELRAVLEHALVRINAAIRGEPAQAEGANATELRNKLFTAVKELEAGR
jgi:hypothetical protein